MPLFLLAVVFAAQDIKLDVASIVVAGGAESMRYEPFSVETKEPTSSAAMLPIICPKQEEVFAWGMEK
jgi:acetyl-CoA acetyltransferase